MAEQVNQRIEDMINELEQMRRTSLYNEYEINEISRKRKEFEYHIQRHVKQKEDFVQYIAYEMALLEDIVNRRKFANMTEKKKDIEYAIAKRLNKVFKQFIHRFQNEVEVYFEYLKFCKSVGFTSPASGIIGEMLQIHGDKPKVWLLASKWESEEEKNVATAEGYLIKGLQRHPDAEVLYMELFQYYLMVMTFGTESESEEKKDKLLKKADIIWKDGIKQLDDVSFLFKCLDFILKYDIKGDMRDSMKSEIWARKDKKEVWPYIAEKELEGCHWKEIEEFVVKDNKYPDVVNYCIGVYEEALKKFPDENISTKYIHTLLGLNDSICDDSLKISAVKNAWMSCYKSDLLTNDMFAFGVEMLRLQGETSDEEMWKILDGVTEKQSKLKCVWEGKLLLSLSDEEKTMNLLQNAIKLLKPEDSLYLYNLMVDNIKTKDALKSLLIRFRNCENNVMLSIKPKLLRKMYDYNGLKAARDLYEEFIKTPPIQLRVDVTMIEIETLQDPPSLKQIRKCYEHAILHHGPNDADLWNDYIEFEIVIGSPVLAPSIYRRALITLKSELIIEFITKQTMHNPNFN